MNLPAMLGWAYRCWEVGEQFDQRIFRKAGFTIRVTAFHQRGAFMGAPGGFYRYEVKTASDLWWRKIAMVELGSPKPIPDDQFQAVTESCAYFYHGHIFGVTWDRGMTWSIKGGDNGPIFGGQTGPWTDIETVCIGQDGSGTMRITHYNPTRWWEPLPSHNLTTSDFGQTWMKR